MQISNGTKLFRVILPLVLLLILNFTTNCAATADFLVIILPDSQYYTNGFDIDSGGSLQETYKDQATWIVDNLNNPTDKIKFVIHVGDLTNSNPVVDIMPEYPYTVQWIIADDAHTILDNASVPYSVLPGNHDYKDTNGEFVRGNNTKYNQYFGPSRFAGKPWYGGNLNGENDNNYNYFEVDSLQFMVLNLAYAPTKEEICWANDIIKSNPGKRVIIATHSYQDYDSNPDITCGDYDESGNYYTAAADGGFGGKKIWDDLVKSHNNIFMVLSGHKPGIGCKKRRGDNISNTVYQILTDYQSEQNTDENGDPVDYNEPGDTEDDKTGNGWLRKLTFSPNNNKIYATSYSVRKYVDEFNVTKNVDKFNFDRYPSDPYYHTLTLEYDMQTPWSVSDYKYSGGAVTGICDSSQQRDPAIATDSNGNYVIVWEGDNNNNGVFDIFARGFNANGTERFGKIRVNNNTSGQQLNPAITMHSDGRFVVTWQGDTNNNGIYNIFARGFDNLGNARYDDKIVNNATAGQQLNPDIAMDSSGNFVVTWEDDKDGNGVYQIFARGFWDNGNARYTHKVVNSVASGQQLKPAIAMDNDGEFVVTWEDDNDNDGVYDILARGFNAVCGERFHDIQVNSVASGQQLKPAIAMDNTGKFVVAWEDDKDNDGVYDILARGFNAGGGERFYDITVNDVTTGQQQSPAIAMDSSDRFVVSWKDDRNNNGIYNIFAKGFDQYGVARFAESTVNSNVTGQQLDPAVTLDNSDTFITAWKNDTNSNGEYSVHFRSIDIGELL